MTLAATQSIPVLTAVRTYPGVSFAADDVRACLAAMLAQEVDERTARAEYEGVQAVIVAFDAIDLLLPNSPAFGVDALVSIVRKIMSARVEDLAHFGEHIGCAATVAALNNVLTALELNAVLEQRGLPNTLRVGNGRAA